jgi:hypothetical protein
MDDGPARDLLTAVAPATAVVLPPTAEAIAQMHGETLATAAIARVERDGRGATRSAGPMRAIPRP